MRICVYCASSNACDAVYHDVAYRLGTEIGKAGHTLVYGGSSVGSMGKAADGALDAGGQVIGILPRFMADLEWGYPGLTELQLVEDMRERKHRLLADSDAVIAMPGGCGTLEELLEAITLKRLGLYFSPILLLNTQGFYTPFQKFMESVVDARFMNREHLDMWGMIDTPEEALAAIAATPRWREDARALCAPR